MEQNDYYNMRKLIRVSVRDTSAENWYRWQKEIKILGFRLQKEGVVDPYGGEVELPSYCFVKEGVVYEKPYVMWYFQEDYKVKQHFDTYNEAVCTASRYGLKDIKEFAV